MLDGLGVLGDREPQAIFVEQLSDLTREVAGDLYLRRYAAWAAADELSGGASRSPSRQSRPDMPGWCPRAATDDASGAAERVAFAAAVRAEVRAAQARPPAVQLRRHAHPVAGRPGRSRAGSRGRDRLRQRYRVVMVDEFQDTDPVQWDILRAAFHRPRDADLDRRPEAGDLRVPRSRRLQLPGRGRPGRPGADAGHQLAQRRSAARWARCS